MYKYEVAYIFRLVSALLTLKGEEAFKVRSYDRVASVLERGDYDIEVLAKEGRLLEVPGIGKNLEPKIREIVLTGRSSFLERLIEEVPLSLLELTKIPGIGPKTAWTLHKDLGISSLSALEDAVNNHVIQKIPGLGAKREKIIEEGIVEVKKYLGRVTIGIALPMATRLLNAFRGAQICGTMVGETGRSCETVSSLCLLLDSTKERLTDASAELPVPFNSKEIWESAWQEEEQRFLFSTNIGIPLEIYVAGQEGFGLKSLLLTGPSEFKKWLTEVAGKKGYELVSGEDMKLAGETEERIFEKLGLSFVPSEARHRPEFLEHSLKGFVPSLLELSDIKGDLHIHTVWSDGIGTIEQMVKRAVELGYSYIAITDHATTIKVIGGLTPRKIEAQLDEIKEVSEKYPEIRILSGAEVDILKDGNLVLPDDILEKLDVVVASVHQDIGSSERVLRRLVKAAENPNVDIIGHPTGRLIGKRAGYSGDLGLLFEAAASNGTVLEVNSSPDRLDLSEDYANIAASCGVRLSVSTDAHSPSGMGDMIFGVASSIRRAGLGPEAVINAQNLAAWFPIKGKG